MVVHKKTRHPGLHQPIIKQELWDRVQASLTMNRVEHRSQTRARVPSPLAGLVFDSSGERLTLTHSRRASLRYRYCVSQALVIGRPSEMKRSSKRLREPTRGLRTFEPAGSEIFQKSRRARSFRDFTSRRTCRSRSYRRRLCGRYWAGNSPPICLRSRSCTEQICR